MLLAAVSGVFLIFCFIAFGGFGVLAADACGFEGCRPGVGFSSVVG